MNIPIPTYFSLYNAAAAYQRMPNQMAYYTNFKRTPGQASACIACGACTTDCPQHIDIPGFMKKVAEMFEN